MGKTHGKRNSGFSEISLGKLSDWTALYSTLEADGDGSSGPRKHGFLGNKHACTGLTMNDVKQRVERRKTKPSRKPSRIN
jgi:hypothetical protein